MSYDTLTPDEWHRLLEAIDTDTPPALEVAL
ncbi:hypothetical protein SAMN06265347_13114 [Halobellus salinus]|nr:hypothetical protein SAMN06265347_13114 [Halobellus salinus]